jgi:hypothetical protein
MILLPVPLSESLNTLFAHLSERFTGSTRSGRRWGAVMAAGGALLALQVYQAHGLWRDGIRPWEIATETRRDVPGVPFRAVALMQSEQIEGNLLTDYGWGQYVLWHLYPHNRVAFDGRYRTVYPADLEREFLDFQKTAVDFPATTPLLDTYATEIVLLPTARGPCDYLDRRDDWVKIFADEQATLYVRDLPRFRGLIAKSRGGTLEAPAVAAWHPFPAGPREGNPVRWESARWDRARPTVEQSLARAPFPKGNTIAGAPVNKP